VLWARRDPGTGLYGVCMPFLGSTTLNDLLDLAYPSSSSPPPHRAAVIFQAIRATARPEDPAPEHRLPGQTGSRGYTAAATAAHGGGSFVRGVVQLGAQLANALVFLHANGRAHCDLKPSNVLLTPDGRPLLLDFNLSLGGELDALRLGGTLPYMPPERVRAYLLASAPGKAPASADVFALGVILYQLLTGKHPVGPLPADLADKLLGELLLKRHEAGFIPLRKLNPRVPVGLARLIERCLAFQPSVRPSSAEVARRLRAPEVRRRWLRRGLLAGLLGAALIAAGWQVWKRPVVASLTAAPGRRLVSSEPDDPITKERAWKALREGRLEVADRLFRRAIQSHPEDPLTHRGLGQVLILRSWAEKDSGREKDRLRALDTAVKHFQQAIELREPALAQTSEAWLDHFGMARAQLLAGNTSLALMPFEAAEERRRQHIRALAVAGVGLRPLPLAQTGWLVVQQTNQDGRALAGLSYCQALNKEHKLATKRGEQALDAGFRSAALLNNLGYSYLRLKQLRQAGRCLTEARRRDPRLAAVYFNRAELGYEEHLDHLNQKLVPMPAWVRSEIEEALQRGESDTLRMLAALIYTVSIRDGLACRAASPADLARWRPSALNHLRRAVELGADPAGISRVKLFSDILGSEIQNTEWKHIPTQERIPATPSRLIDPLPRERP
jgi:tetratricopeptide (TPR) repeat protein